MFQFVARLPLEPGDSVTGITNFQGRIYVTTNWGRLYYYTPDLRGDPGSVQEIFEESPILDNGYTG